MKKNNTKQLQKLAWTTLLLVALNFFSSYFFHRLDLTQDKRYTLSKTSLQIIENIDETLYVDVFLEGNFPAEFKRLQIETQQLLEEFSAYNSNIVFQFVNPLEEEEDRVEVMKKFYERGLLPLNVTVEDKGKQSQEVVFPWAVASFGNKSTKVSLLKNHLGASTEDKIISSVQHLEYAFAEAIYKITKEKEKKIAIIKGNGELENRYIADILGSLKESYFLAQFTLDSVEKSPEKTLIDLQKFDLAVIAKPTEPFSDAEKQVLDQFVMKGGKTLWLLDEVKADMDSMYNETGEILAYPKELNLTDMFFKYGVRINPVLIKDEQATPIKLASGNQGSQTQYEDYIWKFAPYIYPNSEHPIVKNIDGIKFEFVNPIELLKNNIQKTVLLSSSEYSKTFGTPNLVSLQTINEETTPKDYPNPGYFPVAVLLEGNFQSVYKNRVVPIKNTPFISQAKNNKMIVVSDGDIIKNQIDKNGYPLELGFDKWTNNLYGNKEFMLNCFNYLLDDTGLIHIRSKEVNLPLLNKEKVYKNYTFAQIITIGLPMLILLVFGFVFTYLRKKAYQK